MLVFAAPLGLVPSAARISTRVVAFKDSTYTASVVPAAAPGLPPVVLLPPIGVWG